MDLDLKELDDLAKGTHADLQEADEKKAPKHKPLPKPEEVEKVVLAKDKPAAEVEKEKNDRNEAQEKSKKEDKANLDLLLDEPKELSKSEAKVA